MSAEDRTAQQFRKMTETPIPKLILSLAAPTILSMLITSIYNLADTFFVGQISTSASGAVGIVSSLMAILQALGFMLGHGAGGIISRSLGSQNTHAATKFASTSFFTALVFGGIITAAGLLTLPDFMMLLGSTETILPHACAYARYILLAAPIMMSSLVMNNILRYEGKASFAMIGLVTGGLLNIALDPLFIFWAGHGHRRCGPCHGPEPEHQLLHPALHVPAGQNGQPVPDHGSHPQPGGVRHHPDDRYAQLWPSGGLNSIGGMLLNIAARGYGDAAVAGMSIVSRIFMFIISVAIGTGQGFQPVAGFNYGAKKYHRVQQACLFTMAASFCFLSVILTACWFNAETLIRLFRDDPEVTAVALPAFRYQCFAMLLQPVIVAGNMLFQSIGKSRRATFLACCRQGVFFIPLILTLPRAFGLLGVEICQPIADVLTFFVTVPFLFPFLRQLVQDGRS